MNGYIKLADGSWGIKSTTEYKGGETIKVTTKAGKVKTVKLGAFLTWQGDWALYSIAPEEPKQAQEIGSLFGILGLFAKAKAHLKYPKIELGNIKISLAGEKAKVPGSLSVTSAERNADGQYDWFGRVLRDGTYVPSNSAPADVADRLRKFAADPAGVAAEHGKLHGNCCFCGKGLEDEKSTAVGYGPTCAENYGLPWGTKAAAKQAA